MIDYSNNSQTIQDLKTARQLLEVRGRTTGVYENRQGQLCIMGALRTAVSGRVDINVSSIRLARSVSALSDSVSNLDPGIVRGVQLMLFNDLKSDQDVFDLFDKTLANLGGMA